MKTKVYKYELPIQNEIVLNLPAGSEILHFGVQREKPCLWVRVNPLVGASPHKFRFAGTGHELGADVGKHIGTIMVGGGTCAFHLFEMD